MKYDPTVATNLLKELEAHNEPFLTFYYAHREGEEKLEVDAKLFHYLVLQDNGLVEIRSFADESERYEARITAAGLRRLHGEVSEFDVSDLTQDPFPQGPKLRIAGVGMA